MHSSWWFAELWNLNQILAISWVFWVIFSICLHELGHGYTAIKCGDPTPLDTGHMTWNPLVHMGVLSLVVFAVTGFTWGAMPVDPTRFRGKYDSAKVAFAGPAVNLILFGTMLVMAVLWETFATQIAQPAQENVAIFLRVGTAFNIAAAIFNLLPIPPLDGSRILANFVPFFQRLYSSEKGVIISLLGFMAVMFFVGKYVFLVAIGVSDILIDLGAALLAPLSP